MEGPTELPNQSESHGPSMELVPGQKVLVDLTREKYIQATIIKVEGAIVTVRDVEGDEYEVHFTRVE